MRASVLTAAVLLMSAADATTQGRTTITAFIASDCPIANAYAPEIVRICAAYQPRGLSCTLAYEDAKLDAAGLQKHLADYALQGVRSTWDKDRKLADQANVTITPTAIVRDGRNNVRYRGRIDNLY